MDAAPASVDTVSPSADADSARTATSADAVPTGADADPARAATSADADSARGKASELVEGARESGGAAIGDQPSLPNVSRTDTDADDPSTASAPVASAELASEAPPRPEPESSPRPEPVMNATEPEAAPALPLVAAPPAIRSPSVPPPLPIARSWPAASAPPWLAPAGAVITPTDEGQASLAASPPASAELPSAETSARSNTEEITPVSASLGDSIPGVALSQPAVATAPAHDEAPVPARPSSPSPASTMRPVASSGIPNSSDSIPDFRHPAGERPWIKRAPVVVAIGATLLLGFLVTHRRGHRADEGAPTAAREGTELPATAMPAAAPSAAPGPGARSIAPAARLESARNSKADLNDLAVNFPRDPAVRVALASIEAKAGEFEPALESVKMALTLDPAVREDPKVAGVLWRAAQSPSSPSAFELMRELGGRGADIQYDLAAAERIAPEVRTRAEQALAGPEFGRSAEPDTRLAAELLRTRSCRGRKQLLGRAAETGKERTLARLRAIEDGTSCRNDSCACMRGQIELAEALRRVSERVKP